MHRHAAGFTFCVVSVVEFNPHAQQPFEGTQAWVETDMLLAISLNVPIGHGLQIPNVFSV